MPGRAWARSRPRARQHEPDDDAAAAARDQIAQTSRRSIPLDPEMQRRLDEARKAAAGHDAHEPGASRQAPRNTRLER